MTKSRIVFVHGLDGYGAAAWPSQHRLAGDYDALFLKRTGFDAVTAPVPPDLAADTALILDALGAGGQIIAHEQGAVAAMLAALAHPERVHSLVLVEPALPSLTAELPATVAFREQLQALYDRGERLSDIAFAVEYQRLTAAAGTDPADPTGRTAGATAGRGATPRAASGTPGESVQRRSARIRLQAPPWEAPLHFVPGVPTLVLTGGWEPLYEEIASYLAATGARHAITRGGHRPQDSSEGALLIEEFLAGHAAGGASQR